MRKEFEGFTRLFSRFLLDLQQKSQSVDWEKIKLLPDGAVSGGTHCACVRRRARAGQVKRMRSRAGGQHVGEGKREPALYPPTGILRPQANLRNSLSAGLDCAVLYLILYL